MPPTTLKTRHTVYFVGLRIRIRIIFWSILSPRATNSSCGGVARTPWRHSTRNSCNLLTIQSPCSPGCGAYQMMWWRTLRMLMVTRSILLVLNMFFLRCIFFSKLCFNTSKIDHLTLCTWNKSSKRTKYVIKSCKLTFVKTPKPAEPGCNWNTWFKQIYFRSKKK